jgi:hypothetical protein
MKTDCGLRTAGPHPRDAGCSASAGRRQRIVAVFAVVTLLAACDRWPLPEWLGREKPPPLALFFGQGASTARSSRPRPPTRRPVTQQGTNPVRGRTLVPSVAAVLREVATAQQRYHSIHGRYTTDVRALSWRFDPNVTVQITSASTRGWAAVARHRTTPSRSCVYFEGPVPRRPATLANRLEGIHRSVVCDPF